MWCAVCVELRTLSSQLKDEQEAHLRELQNTQRSAENKLSQKFQVRTRVNSSTNSKSTYFFLYFTCAIYPYKFTALYMLNATLCMYMYIGGC